MGGLPGLGQPLSLTQLAVVYRVPVNYLPGDAGGGYQLGGCQQPALPSPGYRHIGQAESNKTGKSILNQRERNEKREGSRAAVLENVE